MGPRGTVGNQPCSGRCAQVACTVPVEWRVEHIVLRHAEPRGTNHVLRDARRWLVLDGLEPLALRHAETRGTNHVLGDAHRWLVQFLLNGEWSISSFAMRNRGEQTMFSAMRAGGLCWTVWSLLPFATRKRGEPTMFWAMRTGGLYSSC